MRRIMTLVPKYLALICFALAALIPFQYMLATAMTPSSYSMPYPPILFPETMYGGNFAEAWNANHFSQYFLFRSYELERFHPSPNHPAAGGKYPHCRPCPLQSSG